MPTCPPVPHVKAVSQMVLQISPTKDWDLDLIGQGHSKFMDLKGLPTCLPVPNMKVVGQTVLKISPTKDWPWTIRSRSLKFNGLVGLVNLSPSAKFESCRSNGSPDITYKRLTLNNGVKVTQNQWSCRLVNLSPCAKFEGCRSNVFPYITYKRLTLNNWVKVTQNQTVLKISPTKDWDLEQLGQGHSKLIDL